MEAVLPEDIMAEARKIVSDHKPVGVPAGIEPLAHKKIENQYGTVLHIGDNSQILEDFTQNGITIRQNNEPAGDQHAFHYHMHIFPRYTDDNFNQKAAEKKQLAPPEVRNKYAEKLKNVLSNSF